MYLFEFESGNRDINSSVTEIRVNRPGEGKLLPVKTRNVRGIGLRCRRESRPLKNRRK